MRCRARELAELGGYGVEAEPIESVVGELVALVESNDDGGDDVYLGQLLDLGERGGAAVEDETVDLAVWLLHPLFDELDDDVVWH